MKRVACAFREEEIIRNNTFHWNFQPTVRAFRLNDILFSWQSLNTSDPIRYERNNDKCHGKSLRNGKWSLDYSRSARFLSRATNNSINIPKTGSNSVTYCIKRRAKSEIVKQKPWDQLNLAKSVKSLLDFYIDISEIIERLKTIQDIVLNLDKRCKKRGARSSKNSSYFSSVHVTLEERKNGHTINSHSQVPWNHFILGECSRQCVVTCLAYTAPKNALRQRDNSSGRDCNSRSNRRAPFQRSGRNCECNRATSLPREIYASPFSVHASHIKPNVLFRASTTSQLRAEIAAKTTQKLQSILGF